MSAPTGKRDGARLTERIELDAGWSTGAAMFGGALVRPAVAVAARSAGVPDWIGIEVSARFLRPIAPGAATAIVDVLHRGRRTAVAQVRIDADAGPALVVLVTLAPAESLPIARDGEPSALPAAAHVPEHDAAAVAERVDWRVDGEWGPRDGALRAWIAPRDSAGPTQANFAFVAADLIVPALPGARRDEPVRVASVSLDVAVLARPASHWLAQELVAERVGDTAHAVVCLSAPAGGTIARALHRAVLLPATVQEMPFSATAFGWGS